eukprot:1816283-Alexandrium_andersonii.AAC.1
MRRRIPLQPSGASFSGRSLESLFWNPRTPYACPALAWKTRMLSKTSNLLCAGRSSAKHGYSTLRLPRSSLHHLPQQRWSS